MPNLVNMSQFEEDLPLYKKTYKDAIVLKKLGTNYYVNYWTSDKCDTYLEVVYPVNNKEVYVASYLFIE